jgi:opine dehydrogenase
MAVRRIAVLGAGHGGCAAAADLTLRGYEVALFSRSAQTIASIRARGAIRLEGAAGEGEAAIGTVTTDLAEAVRDANLLLLVVPVSAYPFYARALAPLIGADHIILLNPGHMGGALYIAHEIHRLVGRRDLRLCEVATLTYSCRLQAPAVVRVFHVVQNLAFAAFPGSAQPALYQAVRELYPGIVPVGSVLETGFLDINAIEHPAQALCNAGWIEHTRGDYLFYFEGTTPAVGRVIDQVDRERVALAAAARVPTKPFVQYFRELGYTTAEAAATGTAHAAMQASAPNRWTKGPKSLDHRYVHEDVGWGLVPWAEMGGALAVPTPTMDALITLASIMNGIDYRLDGLTLERLGLAGRDLRTIAGYLHGGIS